MVGWDIDRPGPALCCRVMIVQSKHVAQVSGLTHVEKADSGGIPLLVVALWKLHPGQAHASPHPHVAGRKLALVSWTGLIGEWLPREGSWTYAPAEEGWSG